MPGQKYRLFLFILIGSRSKQWGPRESAGDIVTFAGNPLDSHHILHKFLSYPLKTWIRYFKQIFLEDPFKRTVVGGNSERLGTFLINTKCTAKHSSSIPLMLDGF